MNTLIPKVTRLVPSIYPHDLFEDLFSDLEKDIFERKSIRLPFDVRLVMDKEGNVAQTHLVFALAGFSKEAISVKVVDDELLLHVEKTKDDENVVYQHKGISTSEIKLKFRLTGYADVDNIHTTFENGLLEVVIPSFKRKEKTINIG